MADELEYEWDERKRASNPACHGVDFTKAHQLDWDSALTIDQQHGDELRYLTYAPIDERLYALVWTHRSDVIRIISFRKANSREVTSYEQVEKI